MTPNTWRRKYMRDFPNIDVPCGTCVACCTNYSAEGFMELKENGDCVHLEQGKCQIYEDRAVSIEMKDKARSILGAPGYRAGRAVWGF